MFHVEHVAKSDTCPTKPPEGSSSKKRKRLANPLLSTLITLIRASDAPLGHNEIDAKGIYAPKGHDAPKRFMAYASETYPSINEDGDV